MPGRTTFVVTLAVMALALVVSAIAPADRFTWVLETVPVMVGLVLLAATRERFPLTGLVYGLIAVHAVILCLGGHYTYAEVPLGFWVQDAFGFERNHYDRLGHFFQGFEPALLAREAFLGTQGDVWDPQWDMFMALCGALLAQLVLGGVHDRQLAKLPH